MKICQCEYCKNVRFPFILPNWFTIDIIYSLVAEEAYTEHKFLNHNQAYFNLKTKRWRKYNG